jgi:RNA-directed DNA polymerase
MHKKEFAGSIVRATARPESDTDDPRQWAWVEATVWTDRMLAALGNGVRGGKWNAFFAQHGLFTLHEAYTAASQSRKGNC